MSENNPELQKIGFLLLGKAGAGKSSLGNSILKYKTFRTSSSGSSVTQRVSCQWAQYGHYDIHVIDGPGLEDTNLSIEDNRKRAIENIMTIFTDYPENVTTFLIAFKYANLITNEDTETLMSLKEILGDEFLRFYGITVITYGDWLEKRIADGEISSFEDWKLNEILMKSGIGRLIEECQGRCVLFNNREKDPDKQNQQLDKLLHFATSVKQRCPPYQNPLLKETTDQGIYQRCEENPGLQKIGFLLLGKTGSGKSALGNSILKYKAFRVSPSGNSVTQRVSCQWAQYGHYDIQVIDGPGLEDTHLSREDDRERTKGNLMTIFTDYPENITTFLFAFKFATRFTNEDREALISLKQILRDEFPKLYSIVVITGGDDLDNKIEDGEISSFEDWKRDEIAQKSGIGLLIEECQGRCVLFNNREKDPDKQNQQLDKLLHIATSVQKICPPYHNTLFKEMYENQQKFIVQSKTPELKEKYSKSTSLLMADVSHLKKNLTVEGLDRLLKRILDLLKNIEKEDTKTKVLEDCKQILIKLKIIIEELINNYNSMSRYSMQSELTKISKLIISARKIFAYAPSRVSWWERGSTVLTAALTSVAVAAKSGVAAAAAVGAGIMGYFWGTKS